MAQMRGRYLSDEWLHWRRGGRLDARTVRISSTTQIGTASYKAEGGLIRVTMEEVEDRIHEIVISGDFFMLPSDAISGVEKALIGAKTTEDEILARIEKAYKDLKIESPLVTAEDFNMAIKMALGSK